LNDRVVLASWPASWPRAAVGSTALFATTILLGAGLIFTVEPMFAKMVLPRAGGSPAVWNTCVVFFQAAMLAGYAYAHMTTRWLPLRWQVSVHVALVLLATFALPVAVPPDWTPPTDATPIPWLLLTLAARLGAPFLVLSATAPLLQKWFASTDHPSAADPYHLYAASNIGSLVALIAYPLAIERMWTLQTQSAAWAGVYGVFVVLVVGCAAMAIRPTSAPVPTAIQSDAREIETVTWHRRGHWLLLSFVPSSLLLGVTTYLSTDIAAVPLLWTVPLALYLLTFAISFARKAWIPDRLVQRATPLLVCALIVPMTSGISFSLLLIPAHLIVFFACALSLHRALAAGRPGPQHLTEYYLWIAVGGMMGGLFNTLLAPALFDGVVEYAGGLVAACLLQPLEERRRRLTVADILLPAAVGAGVVAATWAARAQLVDSRGFVAVLGLLAVASFSFSRRPIRFGLAVAAIIATVHVHPAVPERLLAADRTFFGVLRVRADETGTRHELLHGRILHGMQALAPARRAEPLSYYHRSGPAGQVLTALAGRLRDARIGVVGLGAGSLAAYAAPGQSWTFFEIDPAVARIARNPAFFTYLEDCGSRCEIVLGDARLSLARSSAPAYDLLLLDAFSSDAIPVHLLTREALQTYLTRLAPNGVLAFHISNRHLHLRPVLAGLAASLRLASLVQLDRRSAREVADGHAPSEWFLMSRDAADFGALSADSRWQRPLAAPDARVWTDDFADVFSTMKAWN
jgi:hypothetical protein